MKIGRQSELDADRYTFSPCPLSDPERETGLQSVLSSHIRNQVFIAATQTERPAFKESGG